MKNGKKVEDLILGKLDDIETKLDNLLEITIPAIKIEMATIKTTATTEARIASKFNGMIWGGISAVIAITSVAVAFFKK